MRRIINAAFLLILLALLVGLSGCLTEERRAQIVLGDENCEPFHEVHDSDNFTSPYLLDIASELDTLLDDNELSRSDIIDAFLVSASYEVLEFEQDHDWDLEGVITIERIGGAGPVTLLDYNGENGITVSDAIVGDKTYVDVHPDGVAVINQALDDFITGSDPILRIVIDTGNITPDPSPADVMDFHWEFCLFIQVITELETDVYDPL
jgi:hypothetical protein